MFLRLGRRFILASALLQWLLRFSQLVVIGIDQVKPIHKGEYVSQVLIFLLLLCGDCCQDLIDHFMDGLETALLGVVSDGRVSFFVGDCQGFFAEELAASGFCGLRHYRRTYLIYAN